MSTNKTKNLGLHSWVRSDRFMMDEFNENFDKLDQAVGGKAEQDALDALTGQIAAKAEQSALETLTGRVDKKAEQSALDAETAAREAALAALTGQVGALDAGRLRFKIDSYKGNNAKTVRLPFDFKPLMLIVTAHENSVFGGHLWIRGPKYGRTYNNAGTSYIVSPTWEDRAVQWDSSSYTNAAQWLNDSSTTYSYLAIGIAE